VRAVLVLLLAGAATLLGAAETAIITLRETASVAADGATIGDLADIEAPPALRDILAAVAVQELPDLAPRSVEAGAVRALARRAAPAALLTVRGSCRLVRAAQAIPAAELEAAARSAVQAALPGAVVAVTRAATALSVPAGTPPDLVAEPLAAIVVGAVPLRVRVLRHGRELGRTLVVLQVSQDADQVVAARAIARGAVIDLADLRVERLPLRAGMETVADPDALAGSVAKADIAEGAPVLKRSVRPHPLVEGGQPVVLVYAHGDFALSAPATAMGDGVVGDQVNVRRETDGRMVLATVTGPGAVEISR
jgi:flagella basal body P-ring formation protein FlgA